MFQTRPKHRRNDTDAQNSRKKVAFKFYLNVKESANDKVEKHVCKKMFLNTLCIGEKAVRSWVLNDESGSGPSTAIGATEVGNTLRSERSAVVNHLQEFLNSLPKIESHYCRASSSKLYLEPTWSSFRQMHRHYIKKCQN